MSTLKGKSLVVVTSIYNPVTGCGCRLSEKLLKWYFGPRKVLRSLGDLDLEVLPTEYDHQEDANRDPK